MHHEEKGHLSGVLCVRGISQAAPARAEYHALIASNEFGKCNFVLMLHIRGKEIRIRRMAKMFGGGVHRGKTAFNEG